MKRLILASGSPRRKELLKELGHDFEVIPSNADETLDLNNPIKEEIEKLSFKKALSVFKNNKDAIVIGSDTVVVRNNIVYGKPKDKNDAINIIKSLNNGDHQVITAVTILSKDMSETFSTETTVTFGFMSDEEIQEYASNDSILDKAGAYAIQEDSKKNIKSINGDYYSIMGLPVYELNKRLKKYYEK